MTRFIGSNRGRNSRRIVVSVTVLSILLLVGYGWVELNGGWTAQLATWQRSVFRPQAKVPKPQSSGPSVSWSAILAFAEQEADKIDKHALFGFGPTISARPPGWYDNVLYAGPLTGSLELKFEYYRPKGGSFSIYFEDAAPQDTLDTFVSEYGQPNPDTSFDEDFRRRLAQVKISPREALAITWNEAQTEAEKTGIQGATLEPLITFSDEILSWHVYYGLRQPTPLSSQGGQQATSMPAPATTTSELFMWFVVDAATGQITQRDYSMAATPTPSP